jgi:hypothetical protein
MRPMVDWTISRCLMAASESCRASGIRDDRSLGIGWRGVSVLAVTFAPLALGTDSVTLSKEVNPGRDFGDEPK